MENQVAKIVTTVQGHASFMVPNDLAHFTFTLKTKGEDLALTKSAMQEKIAAAQTELDALKTQGVEFVGEISNETLNYKLEAREGNDKFPAGFQVLSVTSFTVKVSDKLDDVHRLCLKLDSVTHFPTFGLSDPAPHEVKVLDDAAADLHAKLNKECSLLKVSSDDLKIVDWQVGYNEFLATNSNRSLGFNYNGVYGVTGAVGPQGPQGSPGITDALSYQVPMVSKLGSIYQERLDMPKLNSGTMTFRASVRANYIWK